MNTPVLMLPFILKTEWQPTQVFLSGKPMDKGAWWVTVHGVIKNQTQLSDWTTSLGPILGEGNGSPLQYSCLEDPMGGEAWWAAVHGVARSWTQPSDFTFTVHFHALENEMATHSSVLPWAAVYGVTQSQTRLKRLSGSSSSITILAFSSELSWWLHYMIYFSLSEMFCHT